VAVNAVVASVSSISPDNYSPVLKTDLVITLSADYTGAYDTEDFTVQIVPSDSAHKTRTLNVYKTDSGSREITVRYGGAESDVYSLTVHSSSYGSLVTTGITFQAIGEVNTISPTSGSINGGTVLTLTGYTFSDDGTDNQVDIGDHTCSIIESSAYEIKCRTPSRAVKEETTEGVYVYLKASEQAVWTTSNDFTWVDTGSEI